MQQIELFDISRYQQETTTASSYWNDMVGKFTDKLNEEREGTQYRKLSEKRVAMLIAPYKNDLDFFWNKCENGKSFTATFWWHVRPKK